MLKKLLVAASLLLLLMPAKIRAQSSIDVNDFQIRSFEADYYLSRNEAKTSLLRIEEKIVADFPAYNQNHGIERVLPEEYQGHSVSLRLDSVLDDSGQPIEYTTRHENSNLVVRIGDKNTYVHGLHGYKINYSLKNVINFQDTDEFYWDVNGDQWKQSIDRVVARVHIDDELGNSLSNQMNCFAGVYGVNNQATCSIYQDKVGSGTLVEASSSRTLTARENITFVIGFSKGTFTLGPEIAAEKTRIRNLLIAVAMAVLSPIFGSIIFISRRWRSSGRDPKSRQSVVPEYLPPKGFNVLDSDVIINERLRPQAITAMMLDWAVRHYVVISETRVKKIFKDSLEYELNVVKDMSNLSSNELKVAEDLFGGNPVVGSTVKLNTLTNKLYKTVIETDRAVGEDLAIRKMFVEAPSAARKKYLKIGGAIMFISFIGFIIPGVNFLTAGFLLGGLIIMAFSGIMPKRTTEGVALKQYLEGLKMYMKLAEKERIEFSQGLNTAERVKAGPASTEDKIKLFERLLPYAVLFGLDRDWAKEFASLYTQPPSWYGGNMSTFQGAAFVNSLGTFGTATNNVFTAPSSSGGSGFGGGGFSGGGGGGGGGGGW